MRASEAGDEALTLRVRGGRHRVEGEGAKAADQAREERGGQRLLVAIASPGDLVRGSVKNARKPVGVHHQIALPLQLQQLQLSLPDSRVAPRTPAVEVAERHTAIGAQAQHSVAEARGQASTQSEREREKL